MANTSNIINLSAVRQARGLAPTNLPTTRGFTLGDHVQLQDGRAGFVKRIGPNWLDVMTNGLSVIAIADNVELLRATHGTLTSANAQDGGAA